jgi:chromosome segregation ATPase
MMSLTRPRLPGEDRRPIPSATLPMRPDQLHPAAAEAAANYSDALTRAARLERELAEVRIESESASRHVALLQQRLDQSEEHRRMLERYAIEIKTHLDNILTVITTAQQRAMHFARTEPTPKEVTDRLEQAVGEVVSDIAKTRDAAE